MFGMRERGGGLGLALEAQPSLGVGGEGRGQDLDRHVTAQLGVAGPVDLAHAALAERGGDLVVGETGSDQDCSWEGEGRSDTDARRYRRRGRATTSGVRLCFRHGSVI